MSKGGRSHADDPARDVEQDPSAELGLSDPVRDRKRLGDSKYSVTPPRSEVRPPADAPSGRASCEACSAELEPEQAFRIDAKEYAYHFCGAECYQRWRSVQPPSPIADK